MPYAPFLGISEALHLNIFHQNGTSFMKIFSDMSGLERTLVLSDSFESADLYFVSRVGWG
jgi:hypothetical protein